MQDSATRLLINQFLKDIFYRVLDIQAKQVSIATEKRLSRTEMHAIEIIRDTNTPILTTVAERLRVSKATASVSIDRLVKKGFVTKKLFSEDKRKYSLALTDIGELCYQQHNAFHEQMVEAVLTDFKLDDYPELLRGLGNLAAFFNRYK